MLFRVFIYCLAGYGILVFIACLLQRNMLYFPHTKHPPREELRRLGLELWPPGGGEYKGLISDSPGSRGVVVVFHGNAGAAWNRAYYVEALAPLGYRVLLAEYPGYGGRKGSLGEESFVADAKELVEKAHEEFGEPIFLWGESLGCGVAAGVAADPQVPVKGLVMLTPWDSLANLAKKIYWFLPVGLLLRDKYDNVKNLQAFKGPVAVAVAEKDEIVPKEFGLNLYESLPGKKRLWVFPGAGHNDWPSSPKEGWWKEVMEFLSQGGNQIP